MSSPSTPDPYLALGLTPAADQAQIKSTYRKLALKFHPDKVADESKKQEASENFHKIQQAYEIVGDEERRARYDASVRLAALRRDILQKQQQHHQSHPQYHQPPPPIRTDFRHPHYGPPAPPTPGAPTPTFSPRSDRYEQPRSSYDSDDFEPPYSPRPSSRKTSHTEKEHRKAPKSDKEQRAYDKQSERSAHHDRRKHSEKERKKERATKSHVRPVIVEDMTDDSSDYASPHTSPRRSSHRGSERDRDDRHRDSARPRRERLELSDTEPDQDLIKQKMRSASNQAKMYIGRAEDRASPKDTDPRRRGSMPPKNSPVEDLRYSGARRSSVHSDGRDKYDRPAKARMNSAPVAYSTETVSERARPPLEKSHTMPAEVVFAVEKKSKAPPRTTMYAVNGDRTSTIRPETSSRRRPETHRAHSKLSQHVEADNGLPPSPPASPPRRSRNHSYESDDDRHDRPGTTSSRHRIDSAVESTDRKQGGHGSQTSRQHPTLSRLNTEPIFTDRYVEEPGSARMTPADTPTFVPTKSRSSRSKDTNSPDLRSVDMRTGWPGSRRPPTSRSNSYVH